MAGGMMKLLGVLFFFFVAFISQQGTGQPCSVKDLEIRQRATGKRVENKAEWNVTVTNICICSQLNVKLNCKGFKSVEALSIPRSGNECTLTPDLTPIFGYQSLSFTYAWHTKFPFTPIYSEIACS